MSKTIFIMAMSIHLSSVTTPSTNSVTVGTFVSIISLPHEKYKPKIYSKSRSG